MSKRVVTPVGFSLGPQEAGKSYKVITLSEVEALAHEYRTMRNTNVPMEFVGRVIKVAKTVLGANLIPHLSSLYEHRSLVTESDYNYDFLQDTVKFIETGVRPMSISARVQLMEFHEEDSKVTCHPAKSLPFGKNNRMELCSRPGDSGESVYARWLRQPNGLNDMLCTVIVLFGKHNQLCCNK